MQFFWIVLSVLCYLLGQTAVVDARAIGLQKSAFTFPNHNDYQEDSYQLKTERKRQAGTQISLKRTKNFLSFFLSFLGWGKRQEALNDDESDDITADHPYIWFED